MAIYSSATARGFFDDDIHQSMPADAMEITPEYHAALLVGQALGKAIVWNEDGIPVLVDPTPLSEAELLAAERAAMVLTRLQFGLQSLADGVMTAIEAEGFLGPRTIPQIGEDALLLIADAGIRTVARMRLVGFERLERNDPFLVPFQAAVEWTDAQVDDFFRAGMAL